MPKKEADSMLRWASPPPEWLLTVPPIMLTHRGPSGLWSLRKALVYFDPAHSRIHVPCLHSEGWAPESFLLNLKKNRDPGTMSAD